MQQGEPVKRKRRGQDSDAKRRSRAATHQPAWRIPRYLDKPIEPLSAEQIEKLLNAAHTVLETTGVEFMSAEARRILRAGGAIVDEDTHLVRIGRDVVAAAMATAPKTFTITPRNKERALPLGGDALVVSQVASAPNCSDLVHGRRAGTRDDFRKFLKLSQYFNCIHTIGGYPVEPIDIHPAIRGLEAMRDKLIFSDKATHTYSLSTGMVEDSMEMARLCAGLSDEQFCASPRIYTNINTNSPLKIDQPMIEGPIRLAKRGQATIITPFTLAGAMAPVTIAGAVVQQTAEFLAAATVLQLVAPGCPIVMGGFVSNVDMRSGAPAFGTPEFMRGAQMGGQMARRLGVPYRAANVNASNSVDAQALWESVFSLWGVITGGVNYIYHGAGWLEGGLVASFEKFIIDCELLYAIYAYLEPVDTSDAALGLDAIEEVGPGGHFFGCRHTQERFENAFYAPFMSDWRNFQSWFDDGAKSATERASSKFKEILATYKEPEMPSDCRGALDDFVQRRIEEGGVKTDF
jgi:trimethylamine--corrinoid protein Co-methyltransferase